MRIRLIRPQTGAEATGVVLNSKNATSVTLIASGLATTEEVDIEIFNGAGWALYRDNSGNAVVLTATQYQKTLPGGILYRIKKDATAAVGGVIVYLTRQFVDKAL
jgi:hypothetical protein